jgi:hypothetical protein
VVEVDGVGEGAAGGGHEGVLDVERGLEKVAIQLVIFDDGNTNGGIVHTHIIAEVISVFTPSLMFTSFLTQ